MINKRKLAMAAFALLLSHQSFGYEKPKRYISASTYGQFFYNAGTLKIKTPAGATDVKINDMNAQQTAEQELSKYKQSYHTPFPASIAFGYAGQIKDHNYRAELEFAHFQVKANNIGLNDDLIFIKYKESQNDYMISLSHDEVENTSAMINFYHDWENDRFSFSPYVGAGVGLSRLKMFNSPSIEPAYQLKAGLNFHVTEDTDVRVGYRHFGTIGIEKKFTKAITGINLVDQNTVMTNSFFGAHGIEVGLTVHFGSKA